MPPQILKKKNIEANVMSGLWAYYFSKLYVDTPLGS